jgi:hypothetical protein
MFPLSQADAFVEQIQIATGVAEKAALTQDIRDLIKDAEPEFVSNKDLVDAFIGILLVAKSRSFPLAEEVLKALG